MASNNKVKMPNDNMPNVTILRNVPKKKFRTPMVIATITAWTKSSMCTPDKIFAPA